MINNEKVSGNKNVSSDFLRVLLALKSNVMKDLNVAELAIVNQIKNDTYYCSLINSSNITLNCIKLKNLQVQENDIVLVIFTNTDFRQNLKRIKSNQKTIDNVTNENLHNKSYAIIVGII